MTALCSRYEEAAWRARCSEPAVASYALVCVHEHIKPIAACEQHHEELKTGEWTCGESNDVDGHLCIVRIEAPIARTRELAT